MNPTIAWNASGARTAGKPVARSPVTARASSIRSFFRRRLSIRQVSLIAALDEARSIMHAAEAIGMTQPAASTLLKSFEEALGVVLFERHARGIAPTAYGEILIRHARAILGEIDQVQDEISALRSGLSGQASIGTVTTPAANLVPQAVAQLKREHPGLRVTVTVDHSRPLIERLRQGQLDVVVARLFEADDIADLQLEALAEERHALIAAAGHPLAGRRNLRLEEFLIHPWILPPEGSLLRERLTALLLRCGLPTPQNLVEAQSLTAIVGLLHAFPDAVAPLPKEPLRQLCEAGYLVPLIDDIGIEMSAFGIVTRRGHGLSPGAQALVAALRATAGRLYLPSSSTTVAESLLREHRVAQRRS